jgi:hypothetical protein
MTRKERLARFGVVLSMAMAQTALHSLVKLIPGWGTAIGAAAGALTAFAVTRAIGRVVNHHFEREGQTTTAELKKVFLDQKTAAKEAFASEESKVDALRESHAKEISALTEQLERNEITVEEFDQKVEKLVKGS